MYKKCLISKIHDALDKAVLLFQSGERIIPRAGNILISSVVYQSVYTYPNKACLGSFAPLCRRTKLEVPAFFRVDGLHAPPGGIVLCLNCPSCLCRSSITKVGGLLLHRVL